MKLGAVLLQSPDWQSESAASREPTHVRVVNDTLADRPDLIAELDRHLLAAGMLASRERPSLRERLKAFTSAYRSSVC